MGQSSSARSRGSSASVRVSLPFPVDEVTGLPLIHCPRCHGHAELTSSSQSMRIEKYLQKRGYLNAVPDLTEVNYLNLGMEEARSFLLEVPLKLKNLFGYCETWDTSGALELDHIAELSAGVEMPRIGARLHARISFLSEDWLKSSLKEHIMGVSVGLLSTTNHSLAYDLIWQNLTDPACMSSNSTQEHLGHRLLSSIKYVYKDIQRDSSIRPTRGSSLSGFEAKGLELKDFRTSAPNNSENGAFASPELHGGGDIAVTAFADLSFDLPLKPLRELGIHGHAFISAGNLAKLTEHGRGKFSLTDFLQTFRSSTGFGAVVPTKLFRIEMNYCYILKQFDHDKGKAGVQFNFSSP
ncbi:unnamed protein product [Miscanthus lutarioriparius]|uniref:Bacterial surface antigen (D15) domain-containing protein n=1 Tax=Miscanthus lutarioriparius TaxID=422564 RepID=A0A811RM32_9POAL|nr:unnamed protein product [Miscanthus lutarioriparius]